MAALLSVTLLAGSARAAAHSTAGPGRWSGTWAASPQPARPADQGPPGNPDLNGFADQTLRQIVHTSVGGSALRIRVSNAYGTKNLELGDVTVGLQKTGADLTAAPVPVTFHGRTGVHVPAGGQAVSDPVPMDVAPRTNLAISIHFPTATGPTTNHFFANQANYASGTGDFADQTSGAAFTKSYGLWFYLSGVDVRTNRGTASPVVAFGDDATDGFASTTNGNARWPDALAQRLQQAGEPRGVLNAGILGNRLLSGSACFGPAALARLRDDALRQAGARTVIVQEGMNDFGFPLLPEDSCHTPSRSVTADQIIGAYKKIIAAGHARGVRVIGGTLTPIAGSDYASDGTEQIRATVNDWIRTSHRFDAVADFDKAVRDPADPQHLLRAYDGGDALHLNDAGLAAMAGAVPLDRLR